MEESKEQKSTAEATDNTVTFRLDDAYFEDEIQYPQFTESEAMEIILPEEETEESSIVSDEAEKSPAPTKKRKKKKPLIIRLFNALINLIFLTGDSTIALIRWLIRKPLPLLLLPLRLWLKLVRTQISETAQSVKSRPTSLTGKIKEIARKKAEEKSKDGKEHKPAYIPAFFSYIFSEKRLIKTVVNIAFPLIVIFAVYSLYSQSSSQVFALEVYYNGQKITKDNNLVTIFDKDAFSLDNLTVCANSADASVVIEPQFETLEKGYNYLLITVKAENKVDFEHLQIVFDLQQTELPVASGCSSAVSSVGCFAILGACGLVLTKRGKRA